MIYKLKVRTRQASTDPHREHWVVEVTEENGKRLDDVPSFFVWLRTHQVNACTIALQTEDRS